MTLFTTSIAFASAFLCAGVMGFAIQRGATCTVAAVNEVIRKRRLDRLLAIVEASVWVTGGLLIAQMLRLLAQTPVGYHAGYLTVAGGALLGFGAFVNGACVFGAIARLGSGEWAYLATPFGFYAGCAGFASWWTHPVHQVLDGGSFVLRAPLSVLMLFAAFVIWRVVRPMLRLRADGPARPIRDRIASHAWTPHVATTVIGITFLIMLLLAGAWSYTDVLIELARGMAGGLAARSLLLLALLMGAMLGGRTAGPVRRSAVSPFQVGKCFVGGALMGCGSLLIPGGNDGLLLVGMPLLYPYAWVAFIAMCVSTAAGSLVQQGDVYRARLSFASSCI